jgi:hypothetical protein
VSMLSNFFQRQWGCRMDCLSQASLWSLVLCLWVRPLVYPHNGLISDLDKLRSHS